MQCEKAEVDLKNLFSDSDIRGYLYRHSQEELTQIEEEPAAAAAEQALPVAEDEEPERAGLLCSPIDTNTESLCGSKFQQCQFLLE